MRSALERRGVAVVVVPGEVFLADSSAGWKVRPVLKTESVLRPDDRSLAAAADVLNQSNRVTILAGAGCAGAHGELVKIAAALKAPVVHALRGKEFVEYDNPYDVGMTGLIGFSSGYRAMEHCDALLMLGTDFPYRAFYPEGVPVIQVDVRGEQIGRRVPVEVALVGTVRDTIDALLPLLAMKNDSEHLDRMTAHYRRARARLDRLATEGTGGPLHPQFVAATNGSPIDCNFANRCARTNRCGGAAAGGPEDPCVAVAAQPAAAGVGLAAPATVRLEDELDAAFLRLCGGIGHESIEILVVLRLVHAEGEHVF